MLTRQEIEHGIKEVPALSTVVVELMHYLERSEVNFDDVHRYIARDPALCGRVLAVANSPFYGIPRQIGGLREACQVLGINTIRNIVIATSVMGCFPPDAGNALDFAGLWQHASGTAVTARLLARGVGEDPDCACTAGLLHDVGKMVLDMCFVKHYRDVVEYRDREQCLLVDAERHVLGTDHAEVGALVAERWRLPTQLVVAIGGHHAPSAAHGHLTDLVHVADIVCRGLEIGEPGDDSIPALDPDAVERLALDFDDIRAKLPEIEAASTAAASTIGGDTRDAGGRAEG